MKVLDLFAGIGGFAIASHWAGFETAQFVEIDKNAQKVLRHHYPDIPIHDDVRTYKGTPNKFDIITAGFPCTGTSAAGKKTGLDHAESKLFYEILRITHDTNPSFIVIENPVGLINNGLREILALWRMAGYSSEVITVSAARLGAGHRRERLFIVSYPHVGSGDPTITITGASKMRALVSTARNYANWLQVERFSYGGNDGVRFRMDWGKYGKFIPTEKYIVPTGIKGRLTARVLLGRTVTPQQALIPMLRIKQLMELA